MLVLKERGAVTLEYGNNLRNRAEAGGRARAFEIGSFMELFIRPLFCQGIGPFRWIANSGEPSDICAIDDLILREFAINERICSRIRLARRHIDFQGLPARIGWLGHTKRSRLAILVNDAVGRGETTGPVALSRDHLDAAAAVMPFSAAASSRSGTNWSAESRKRAATSTVSVWH
jgi:urocanate hydratase